MNTPLNVPGFLVIHHSTGSPSVSNAINESIIENSHKQRGFPEAESGYHVGYHFMVFTDGQVKRYREDHEIGAHTKTSDGMNFKSLGICLIGNFSISKPTREQSIAALSLIETLMVKHSIPASKVQPHRKFADTQCWGNNLSDNVISELKKLSELEGELTDRDWCKKHLPEAEWNSVDPNLCTAFRSLAKRVLWR